MWRYKVNIKCKFTVHYKALKKILRALTVSFMNQLYGRVIPHKRNAVTLIRIPSCRRKILRKALYTHSALFTSLPPIHSFSFHSELTRTQYNTIPRFMTSYHRDASRKSPSREALSPAPFHINITYNFYHFTYIRVMWICITVQ